VKTTPMKTATALLFALSPVVIATPASTVEARARTTPTARERQDARERKRSRRRVSFRHLERFPVNSPRCCYQALTPVPRTL
jgi:hypothetical protein